MADKAAGSCGRPRRREIAGAYPISYGCNFQCPVMERAVIFEPDKAASPVLPGITEGVVAAPAAS